MTTTKLERIAARIRDFQPSHMAVDPHGDIKKLLKIMEEIVGELQRIDRVMNHK